MKKLISVILVIMMLFTVAAPAASAAAAYTSSTPIIVVHGLGSKVIGRDGKLDDNSAEKVKDVLLDDEFLDLLTAEFLLSEMTGNWEPYADLIYDYISPCFANTQLENNGECYKTANGRTFEWGWNEASLGGASSFYKTGSFNYYIDWRLDPMAIADDLSAYIDAVLSKTGAEKVKLLVRCMGSNVVLSYLAKNESAYSKVSDICFYSPVAEGVNIIGAGFSGQLYASNGFTDTWLGYMVDTSNEIDDSVKELASALMTALEYVQGLGITTAQLDNIFAQVRDSLVPRLVMSTFGTYPGYWAMVGDEYFDDAVDFIFSYGDYKEQYEGLISKINTYDKTVRSKTDAILDKAEARGISVSVIAKYNVPTLPLYVGCNITGDGTSQLDDLSFGATGGVCLSPLTDMYLNNVIGTNREKYLSPDKMVDASTARFADRTWFIRDCSHGTYPADINNLADYIFNDNVSTETVTVFTDTENWPQYLDYDSSTGKVSPLAADDTADTEAESDSPFSAIIRFFTKIMNFFSKLFKGELLFGGLFG